MSSSDINSPVRLAAQGRVKSVELHSCKTRATQWGIRNRLLILHHGGKEKGV